MKYLIYLIPILLLAASCGSDDSKNPDNTAIELKPGQLWSYKTRPGEEKSTIQILKIETNPNFGKVVHINVNGIKIRNPLHPKGYNLGINHLPLAEDAVRKSIVKLVQENVPVPDYSQQYKAWLNAVNTGKGGVLSQTVDQILNNIQNSINQRPINKNNEAKNTN